jgi:2-iminobutanoate/2-iminopropanoate deaminase
MSKTKIIHPQRSAQYNTGAYSDAVLTDGFLFVSGQASVDFISSQIIKGSLEEECRRTLENIRSILSNADMTFENVLKCTVHLADIKDFDAFNQIYSEYFTGVKPARTTVQSVMVEGLKIEIDCIAKK